MIINGQSEVLKVRSILLVHPMDAWICKEKLDQQWQELNYCGRPELEKAIDEYGSFLSFIEEIGARIYFIPQHIDTGLDSIYVHDPVIITKKGAILCNMGKRARSGEPGACAEFLEEIGVPVYGQITGEGRLEGGDVVWLDEKTLCVGEGYRTNPEGIDQLKKLTSEFVDDFVVVPLVHDNGPGDVLHLMSIISPVDHDKVVVYSRLMPVRFRNFLIDRGMQLIEVPDEEYATMACNILALEPGKVVMLESNPITRKLMEEAGVEVLVYKGDEISKKGAGGPTCLTRPLLRE